MSISEERGYKKKNTLSSNNYQKNVNQAKGEFTQQQLNFMMAQKHRRDAKMETSPYMCTLWYTVKPTKEQK